MLLCPQEDPSPLPSFLLGESKLQEKCGEFVESNENHSLDRWGFRKKINQLV